MLSESRIEQERVRFESELIKSRFYISKLLERNKDGEYIGNESFYGFKYWLAAIEAQEKKEVIIPKAHPCCGELHIDAEKLLESLEQQGMVVKL